MGVILWFILNYKDLKKMFSIFIAKQNDFQQMLLFLLFSFINVIGTPGH